MIESLAPRILLSADLPGLDVADTDPDPDDPLNADVNRILAQAEEAFLAAAADNDPDTDQPVEQAAAVEQVDQPDTGLPSAELSDDVRRELIIVDPSVPDYEILLADVRAVGGEDSRLDIAMIDPQRNGIEQITEILALRNDLDAIHLISHGSDGEIHLGSETIDKTLLQQDADTFRLWGDALSANGDILIYGCDLAATPGGEQFVDTLARLTGADIAASDDLTGDTRLGGDWELEYAAGQIETTVAVGADGQQDWSGVLAETIYVSSESAPDVNEIRSDQNWGQSFSYISGNGTYNVNQLSLLLSRDAGATPQDITVSLRTSWSGPDLATDTVASASLATGMAWQAFDIGDLSLNDGATYYLRVSSDSIDGNIWVGVDASGSYPSGDLIAPTGSPLGGEDLAFRVAESTANSAPVISSDGGGATAGVNVVENTTAVTTVTATDADLDTPTYSMSGGADTALFNIDGTSGVLSFNTAPDFESPADADADNVYQVTVQVADGNGGTDTQAISVTVTDVNEAPTLGAAGNATLTQIDQGATSNNGDSVVAIIASAGGDPITDVDASATEGIAITWLDDSNGSWEYSTDGGSNWTAIGAVSDTSALLLTDVASNRIRFVPAADFSGSVVFTFQAWDRTDGNINATAAVDVSSNGGTTAYSTASETASITVQPLQRVVYLATSGDVTVSGAPGLGSWDAGEAVALGGPNINLEPGTTDGALYSFLDLRNFDTGTIEPAIDSIHQVGRNTTIGGNGGPDMDLFVGDILFSVNSNNVRLTGSDLVEITTDMKDLYLFRPDTPGDYSAGSFSMVLDNFATNEAEGISLVEADTMVGDTLLQAGSFLYNPGNSRDIFLYTVNGVGEGTTSGVSEVLISGTDIGMSNASAKVSGIDLVEGGVSLGGTTLAAGNILVTLDGNDASVGGNGLAVTPNDVFFLDVTTTSKGPTSTSVADAYLLIEGADINLDTANEEITAISLDANFSHGNLDPGIFLPGGSISYNENDPAVFIDAGATVNDPDSFDFATGVLQLDFTAGGMADDRLAIYNEGGGAGQVGVAGTTVTYAGVAIGTFAGGTGTNPLVVNFNSNADASTVQAVLRNITYANVSDDPATAVRNVRVVLSDGDGGTSNLENKIINVTAVNDAPALVANTGITLAEGASGAVITNLMLNEDDPDDSGSGVVYTVTSLPANGALYLGGVAIASNDSFTQADIAAGLITYDHDGSETPGDSFTFTLADGGEDGATPLGGQVFSIAVTPVNDAPVITSGAILNVAENTTAVTTVTAADVDIPAQAATWSIVDGADRSLFSIDENTGVLAFRNPQDFEAAADADTDGVYEVTVQTDDGAGGTDTRAVSVTVGDVDEAALITGVTTITDAPEAVAPPPAFFAEPADITGTPTVIEDPADSTQVGNSDPDIPRENGTVGTTGRTDPSGPDNLPTLGDVPSWPAPLELGDSLLSVLADSWSNDTPKTMSPADKPSVETAQTFLQELKSFWEDDSAATSLDMSKVRLSQEFWSGLDKMANDMEESVEQLDAKMKLSAEAAAIAGTGVTAIFTSRVLRAGSMAASFLAAMRPWQHVDPMPLLGEADNMTSDLAASDSADTSSAETGNLGEDDRVGGVFDRK